MKRHKYFKKEVQEVKKAIYEAIIALKTVIYLTAWIAIILILNRWSTPVAALVGIGLYVTNTLAIVRGS